MWILLIGWLKYVRSTDVSKAFFIILGPTFVCSRQIRYTFGIRVRTRRKWRVRGRKRAHTPNINVGILGEIPLLKQTIMKFGTRARRMSIEEKACKRLRFQKTHFGRFLGRMQYALGYAPGTSVAEIRHNSKKTVKKTQANVYTS